MTETKEVIDRLQEQSFSEGQSAALVRPEEGCPFCGNRATEELSFDFREAYIAGHLVRFFKRVCSCGGSGPDALTRYEALIKWLKRRAA